MPPIYSATRCVLLFDGGPALRILLAFCSLAWFLPATSTVLAQDAIPWAYASYYGTGRYSLEGGIDTTVLAAAPGWLWREPGINESGHHTPGFRFRLPVALGAHEFSSLDQIGGIDRDSINSVSVVPGVEVEFTLSERWSVKSMAYLGLGRESHSNVDAEIFRFGFRSRLTFDLDKMTLQVVNGLERFGYSADNGASDAVNLIAVGLDFGRPLQSTKLGGDPVSIHWHVMYTNYLDTLGLDLTSVSLRPGVIGSEWELGTAFGKRSASLQFWRLKLDRLGLIYRFAADGDFSGIGISFRSLFDR